MSWKNLMPAVVAGAMAAAAYAGDAPVNEVFGWVQKAAIEPWGVEIKAKLDTGALTSSIHATDVERYERNGDEWVRYVVEVEDENRDETVSRRYEKPVFRNVVVRGAGGKERRPVVLMRICMGGKIYEEQFSLRDRDNMLYPMLIGRRTIQHLGLVDVTRTFTHRPACDEEAPVFPQGEHRPDADIGL